MLMDHNVPIYEKFEAMLEEEGQCILITATGTGKSYIAAEYLKRHNLNALVICPRLSVCSNWTSISDRISAITYQKFAKRPKDFSGFDAYIFDEAHHMGGKVWGPVIKSFRQKSDGIFIGLTADSNRYFDGRDVAEEFFDNCIVYGYDISEAVNNGILPLATYVCSLYDTNGLKRKYKNRSEASELVGRLNYSIDNCLSIEEILLKHMPKNHRKGIVFVDSIANIYIGVDLIKKVYPDANVSYIHSKLSNAEVKETLEDFKRSEYGYIVTVDMLNEGLHIGGVNTIIMLRKTQSPAVFMQQIGRGLDPNINDVIIFDFVANSVSLQHVMSKIAIVKSKFKNNSSSSFNISNQAIVYDYATPIITILNQLNKWSDEEIEQLKILLPKVGYKKCSEILGKTVSQITLKVKQLGIEHLRFDRYTEEEDRIIKENYQKKGAGYCSKLTGRSISAIRARAEKLGIYKSIWATKENLDFLIQNYGTLGVKKCAEILGIEETAVIRKAKEFGLRAPIYYKDYEIEYVKENYSKIGRTKCANHLGCSTDKIERIAAKIGVRREGYYYTKDDDAIIINNKDMSISQLQEKYFPNRSLGSISMHRRKLKKEGRL